MVRAVEAFNLRCSGASFGQIADQLKCSRSTAYVGVQKVLISMLEENSPEIEKMRQLENARLDMLWMKIFPNVINATVDKKGIVSMTSDFVDAFKLCIRLSYRRSRLNGLDAAPKVPVDPDGNAVPPELKQVINVLTILNQKAPDAFDKFVEVTTVPGTNGMAKKMKKTVSNENTKKLGGKSK